MKHRIKRLVSMILVLMMGLGMNVMAEEKKPSVTVAIPIQFSSDAAEKSDATIKIKDQETNQVLKTLTRAEITQIGGQYVFPLIYTEPGNHSYSIFCTSQFGEQTAIAEVAVLSDDDGKLSATLVLYWKDTQAKIDKIVFGHADITPTNPQPNQPTPSSPSRPSSSTNQILGAESNSWFMPLLVLAGGIAILFVALVAKRRKGGNR